MLGTGFLVLIGPGSIPATLLLLKVIVMGPITGLSLNPARTFGPVLLQILFGGTYNLAHLAVYFGRSRPQRR